MNYVAIILTLNLVIIIYLLAIFVYGHDSVTTCKLTKNRYQNYPSCESSDPGSLDCYNVSWEVVKDDLTSATQNIVRLRLFYIDFGSIYWSKIRYFPLPNSIKDLTIGHSTELNLDAFLSNGKANQTSEALSVKTLVICSSQISESQGLFDVLLESKFRDLASLAISDISKLRFSNNIIQFKNKRIKHLVLSEMNIVNLPRKMFYAHREYSNRNLFLFNNMDTLIHD